MQPSFPADVSVGDFSGRFEVMFQVVTDSPPALDAVEHAAESFSAAAQTGMFSKDPATDRGAEQISAGRSGDREVRYVWRFDGIQPGAFRVLLNMLEVIHHFNGPLAAVSLHAHGGYSGHMSLAGLLTAPFPMRKADVPFAVTLKRTLENSKEPLVRLEFDRKVDDGDVKVLMPMFVAWDRLVVRGGYLNSIADWDPDIDIEESLSGQQTYLAAPDTVEHLFYEFVGAAAAYDALVNLTVRIHHTLRRVVLLEVE